jgi:hypothetical protein
MIEHDGVLHTWQIISSDFEVFLQGKKIKSKKINNHRLEYLTYEGPISCDRGRVEMYDTGDYTQSIWNNDAIHISVHGKKFSGEIMIYTDKDSYILNYNKINNPGED